ncbi:MAG: ABC transporter substrate-binding protein [Nitriliruptorales bacterium]
MLRTRKSLRTSGRSGQVAASLAVLALALTACGGNGEDEGAGAESPADATEEPAPEDAEGAGEPIKIGLVTDLSGRFVTFGRDIDLATKLAVEQINAEGGINGSPLELLVEDTGGEPEAAVGAIRNLAEAGVFAISGPLSSGEAEVAYAQAPQVQVPLITGTANKEGIADLAEGWAFRNTATNTALYQAAIPAWRDEYGLSSAVLVFDESEPVSAAAATTAVPAVAQQVGVEIVNADSPITFARGQTDFATLVQRLRESEADGLIIMSAPEEAGLIARELQRQDETRPVLGHPAQGTPSFFEAGGEQINDWILPLILNREDPSEKTQAYLDAISARDQEPPTVAEAGNYYDNIFLLAQVMRAAGIDGSTPPEEARTAIKDGLLELEGFEGVTGTITFGGDPDAEKTVWVHVVQAGELKLLAQ